MLKRIIRLSREEITGDLRNVHNYEFHHLHTSPNINRLDEMDGLEARRRDERYNTSGQNLRGIGRLEGLYVNVRIILKWV
jgi:hypothetical protein